MTNDERRRAMVAAARACKGTPWQHQGRIPGIGLDCIGLALAAADASGLLTPEMKSSLPFNYGRLPHQNMFLRTMREHMEIVPSLDQCKIADYVLMNVVGHPMHIGLLTDYNEHGGMGTPFGLLHAMVNLDNVTEQRFDPGRLSIRAYYRMRGLD